MRPDEETLSEYVERAAERAAKERSGYEPEPMKTFSVRLPEKYVNLLDLIAEGIAVSRSDLLGKIIQRGLSCLLKLMHRLFPLLHLRRFIRNCVIRLGLTRPTGIHHQKLNRSKYAGNATDDRSTA